MAKLKKEKSFEDALWDSCDELRGSVEPAEYKHVVLSLIFLKFVGDKFEDFEEIKKLGNGCFGEVWLVKSKINGKKSKPVEQYTIDGQLVARYPSQNEAQRQTGYCQGYISGCCRGRYKTAYGFVWRYA